MVIKVMDCFNYFPGNVELVPLEVLDNYLSRTQNGDNQRRTYWNYIYAGDNLLGGK